MMLLPSQLLKVLAFLFYLVLLLAQIWVLQELTCAIDRCSECFSIILLALLCLNTSMGFSPYHISAAISFYEGRGRLSVQICVKHRRAIYSSSIYAVMLFILLDGARFSLGINVVICGIKFFCNLCLFGRTFFKHFLFSSNLVSHAI